MVTMVNNPSNANVAGERMFHVKHPAIIEY
jgi:hypothetical protein